MAGEHAHLLFNIPVLHHQTVTFTAEHMLFSLAKQPIKMAFLQHMDVILIAEIGLISSELFGAIDTVLRHNKAPMGRLVVLATGDPHQLRPVNGSVI